MNRPEIYDTLELVAHHKVELFPEMTFSLAHTKEMVLAICAPIKDFIGLGCDLELKTRKFPARAESHFMNNKDNTSYGKLTTWCIKEACFKALSNAGKSIKYLKEVQKLINKLKQ